MKKYKSFNKIVAATLIASAFVACSDDNDTPSFGTPYKANTGNIASVGTAVDLGLPSGTQWADKNVGAANAQDMGLSFIWGDVTGTQLSTTAATYTLGDTVDMKPYFDMFKKQNADPEEDKKCIKVEYDTLQIAKVDIKIEAVDSVRPNYAYQILIKRTADVKVKDENGGFKTDENGEFIRETKVFVEVDSLILMGHDEETATANKDKFLETFTKDEYNKYTVEKCEQVYYTDVIKKLVPADGQAAIDAIVADAKKAAGKNDAWYYLVSGAYNESDNYLHADLIVEAQDTITYREKNWAMDEVPSLTIVGKADYDAATKNWGASWAMPTSDQLQELIQKCEWIAEGNGYTVVGPNGNSIFLPAAGFRYEAKLIGNGGAGYYASGEVYGKYTYPSGKEQMAGGFGTVGTYSMPNIMVFNCGQFDNSKKIMNTFAEKNIGLSIRPVAK